jgi:mediator of RNA polymerase II transcription subunit 23
VLKLYDLLYDDKEVIPAPDITKASSTHALASTCIWIHLNKKAENDKLSRPIPNGLRDHLEFLKQTLMLKNISTSDYKIALLCNACKIAFSWI